MLLLLLLLAVACFLSVGLSDLSMGIGPWGIYTTDGRSLYHAEVYRDIDTRDTFYDAEDTFYKQQMPTLQPAFKAWTMATLESPFRKELEEKYGVKEVLTYYTGAVIGSHSGPGTLALFYLGEHR